MEYALQKTLSIILIGSPAFFLAALYLAIYCAWLLVMHRRGRGGDGVREGNRVSIPYLVFLVVLFLSNLSFCMLAFFMLPKLLALLFGGEGR